MQFDLAAIDTKTLSDSGVDMVIKGFESSEPLLAKNGKAIAITLLGPDSAAYREFTRAQVRRRLTRMNDIAKANDIDLEEIERDTLNLLVSCTLGWKNVLDTDGNDIPFNAENVRKLYTSYPIVREQVDSFVSSRVNFLKASLGN